MAAPVGLDRRAVVDAAADVVEGQGGLEPLPLREVASRLGVRTQSLYAHVDGADGLRRELALRGLRELADALTSAAIGRAGSDAIEAIVIAWLGFAADHPGLYAASLRPPGDDAELLAATAAATRPLDLVFASYGLDRETAAQWLRILFATVHGFALLRRDGLFTMPADPDDTVRRMVRGFAREIESDAS